MATPRRPGARFTLLAPPGGLEPSWVPDKAVPGRLDAGWTRPGDLPEPEPADETPAENVDEVPEVTGIDPVQVPASEVGPTDAFGEGD